MSTYKFHIANYHAVREANINLDGITVLAGVNGSGKSTIARLLCSTVRVLCDYDSIVDDDCRERFDRLMENLRLFVSDSRTNLSRPLLELLLEIKSVDFPSFDATRDYFSRVMNVLPDVLEASLENIADNQLQRYSQFLGLNPEECSHVQDFIKCLLSHMKNEYDQLSQKCATKKQTRPIADFEDYISFGLDANLNPSESSIQFQEDAVDMITPETFYRPLKLRNVVYINMQYVGQMLLPYQMHSLSDMLARSRGEIAPSAKALVKRLQDIIGADVIPQKDHGRGVVSRYMLTRKNGLTFDLKGAATGEISFSYLLQLIKNGWINENTLLIIDEPESHLHPQWIVDYANILVQLHQTLGTKVMISSHNPDMVSAIQSMAEVEGALDSTHFYLAEAASERDGQYVFTHQGSNIEKIFDSFNIAIDRINEYGRML